MVASPKSEVYTVCGCKVTSMCVCEGCQECVCVLGWIKVITDHSEGGRVKVAVARSHETVLPDVSFTHTYH